MRERGREKRGDEEKGKGRGRGEEGGGRANGTATADRGISRREPEGG